MLRYGMAFYFLFSCTYSLGEPGDVHPSPRIYFENALRESNARYSSAGAGAVYRGERSLSIQEMRSDYLLQVFSLHERLIELSDAGGGGAWKEFFGFLGATAHLITDFEITNRHAFELLLRSADLEEIFPPKHPLFSEYVEEYLNYFREVLSRTPTVDAYLHVVGMLKGGKNLSKGDGLRKLHQILSEQADLFNRFNPTPNERADYDRLVNRDLRMGIQLTKGGILSRIFFRLSNPDCPILFLRHRSIK